MDADYANLREEGLRGGLLEGLEEGGGAFTFASDCASEGIVHWLADRERKIMAVPPEPLAPGARRTTTCDEGRMGSGGRVGWGGARQAKMCWPASQQRVRACPGPHT